MIEDAMRDNDFLDHSLNNETETEDFSSIEVVEIGSSSEEAKFIGSIGWFSKPEKAFS